MSDADGNILLLSDDRVAREMGRLAKGSSFAHAGEPYEALEQLAGGRYDALVVAEGYPDLPGLARAARRLGGATRIYALCSPAGEVELRNNGADELDDYFLFPPSAEEMESIFRAAGSGTYKPAGPEPAPEMTPQDVAALIESADSVAALAEHVQRIVSEWTGVQLRWADATGDEPGEALILIDDDAPKVLLAEPGTDVPAPLRRRLQGLQLLVGPLAAQARRAETLHELAITDFLTGAHNRRYFYHFTDQLLERARQERFRVTLLLYDIDDFKRYNDTYGHAAGDEILREVADVMKQVTRADDIVARIGGDEFAMLFWDVEPPRRPDSRHPREATQLADRFLDTLARHEFPFLGPEAKGVLTISGGLATFPWDGQSCRDLLRHADGALRRAKAAGKNAIYLVGQADIDEAR